MLIAAAMFGSPLPTLADVGADGQPLRPRAVLPVSNNNRFAIPALSLVTIALAAGHLPAAWAVPTPTGKALRRPASCAPQR